MNLCKSKNNALDNAYRMLRWEVKHRFIEYRIAQEIRDPISTKSARDELEVAVIKYTAIKSKLLHDP